ncbi:MAG: DNA polymerase/3'-5' exonuclease PolX [Planctomycetota bacterium]
MTNQEIADVFDHLGDLLEFQGANAFRVRAYRNGARAIRDLPESLRSILDSGEMPLTDIEGIGKDLAKKIEELLETGKLQQLEAVLAEVPESVLSLMRVPGLGPKKAAVLHRELAVETLDDLRQVCETHQVRALKGFGPKTEEQILKGLALAATSEERMLWADADTLVQRLREHLTTTKSLKQLEFAGSYRRGKETVGDLDILVIAGDRHAVMDRLGEFEEVAEIILQGSTKMSVRLKTGTQVDLRVVPDDSFGAALQYFTGSKEHNVMVRSLAKQQGLRVNEYGVYREDDETHAIAGKTESDVYAAVGLAWIPPELREARGEIEAATDDVLPDLITVAQLRGDLHMHTTDTDGRNSLREMVTAAMERGLEYVAITDHSQRVSMAMGLDEERLRAQWLEVDALNAELESFTVLKGVECDILEQGGMDLSDEVLAEADWVLGAIHYGQQQSRSQITDRLIGALRHPHVHAIAHPTGRLLNQRAAYEVDLDAVLQAAHEEGKFLELNAHPKRLDLNDIHAAAAKKWGIPIVINTDAHDVRQLALLRFGVTQARRAGLTAESGANSWPWDRLQQRLAAQA